MKILTVLLAVGVGVVLTVPVSRQNPHLCGKCSDGPHKFEDKVGKLYTYEYTTWNGFEEDPNLMDIRAKLNIFIVTPCLWHINVSESAVTGPNETRQTEIEDELNRFTLLAHYSNNGTFNVCSEMAETAVGYNFKVAIVKSIEITMDSLQFDIPLSETDALGTCPTTYTSETMGNGEYKVTKTKDLKHCFSRQVLTSGFFGQKYHAPGSTIQNVPLLSEENYSCVQHVKDDIVLKAECEQQGIFKPFGGSSASTRAVSKLSLRLKKIEDGRDTFVDFEKYNPPSPPTFRLNTPALFNPDEDLVSTLITINRLSEGTIRPSLPSLSHRLVHLLRALSEEKFRNIHANLEGLNPFARDIVLDALPAVGTPLAIEIMILFIDNMPETDFRIRLWVTSLAFTPDVTSESLRAVLPLMLKKSAYQSYAILGVTSMVYSFCSGRLAECEQDPSVATILETIKHTIGDNCGTINYESELDVKTALKGLGNLGWFDLFMKNIIACAATRDNLLSVRIEAVKALRRMPCDPELVDSTMKLYLDTSEDEEMRIEGYLKTIRCPTKERVDTIVDQLRREENGQIKAFVYTHLTNLNDSTDPSKIEVREILKHVDISDIVIPSLNNYSQNIEWSRYYDKYNMGLTVDKNLVYHPNATVPRSLNVNLTANVFGSALNLLEIGVRAEHVDKYLLQKLKPVFNHSLLRELSQFLDSTILSSKDDEAGASLVSVYANFFGNELFWNEMRDLEKEGVDRLLALMRLVDKLSKERETERAHSVMFLDTSMSYGTVTGHQYTISVNGTGIVALKSDGKFDVRDILKGKIAINGSIIPSASVEVDAIWKLHSGHIHTGLKLKASLHTSTNLSGHLYINKGRLIDFRLDMPRKNNEIFTLKTEFYSVNSVVGERLLTNPEPQLENSYCPLSYLSTKYLGSKLCLTTNVPRPFLTPDYFLNGNVQIQVVFTKEDPTIRGYEMIVAVPESRQFHQEYLLLLDTPGSQRSRRVYVDVILDYLIGGPAILAIEVQTPIKNFTGKGNYTDNYNFQELTVAIDDDGKIYEAMGRVDIRPDSDHNVTNYDATLDITRPDYNINLVGHLTQKTGPKAQLRYGVKSLPSSNFTLAADGVITKDGASRHDLNASRRIRHRHRISFPNVTLSYQGFSERSKAQLSTTSHLEYQYSESLNYTLSLETRTRNDSVANLTRFYSVAEVKSTQFPDLSSRLLWEFIGQPSRSYNNTVRYSSRTKAGDYTDEAVGTVTLETEAWPDQPVRYKSRVSYHSPKKNYEKFAAFEFAKSRNNSLLYDLRTELKLSPEQPPIRTGFRILQQRAPRTVMEVDISFDHPNYKVHYSDKLEETHRNVFKGRSAFSWNQRSDALMTYGYTYHKNKTHHFFADISTASGSPYLTYNTQLTIDKHYLFLYSILDSRGGHYEIKTILSDDNACVVEIKAPSFYGALEADVIDRNKLITLDVDLSKMDRPHYWGQLKTTSVSQKKTNLKAELYFDKNKDLSDKLELIADVTEIVESGSKHVIVLKGTYKKHSIEGGGEVTLQTLLRGPHRLEVEVTNPPRRLEASYELKKEHQVLKFRYTADKQLVLVAEHEFEIYREQPRIELTYRLKIGGNGGKNAMQFQIAHLLDTSRNRRAFASELNTVHGDNQYHSVRASFDKGNGEFEAELDVETPYEHWKTQELRVNGNSSRQHIFLNVSLKGTSFKEATLGLRIERLKRGLKIESELKTPHKDLKNIKFYLEYLIQSATWNLQSNLHHDQVRIIHLLSQVSFPDYMPDLKNMGMQSSISIKGLPTFSLSTKTVSKQDSRDYAMRLIKDTQEILLSKLTIDTNVHNLVETTFHLSSLKQTLVELTTEVSPDDSNLKIFKLETNGVLAPELTTSITIKKDATSIHPIVAICAKNKCFNLDMTYAETDPSKEHYRRILVSLLFTTSYGYDTKVTFSHTKEDDLFNNRLTIHHAKEVYEYNFVYKKPAYLVLEVTIPTRVLRLEASRRVVNERISRLSVIYQPNALSSPKVIYRLKGEVDQSPERLLVDASLTVPRRKRPYTVKLDLCSLSDRSRKPYRGLVEIDYHDNQDEKLTVEVYRYFLVPHGHNFSVEAKVYKRARNLLDLEFEVHAGLVNDKVTGGMAWTLVTESTPKRTGSGFVIFDQREESGSLHYDHPGLRLGLSSQYHQTARFELQIINATYESNHQRTVLDAVFNPKTKGGTFVLRTNEQETRGDVSVILKPSELLIILDAMRGGTKLIDASISFKEERRRSSFTLELNNLSPDIYIFFGSTYEKLTHLFKTIRPSGRPIRRLMAVVQDLLVHFEKYFVAKLVRPLKEQFKYELEDIERLFGTVTDFLKNVLVQMEDSLMELRSKFWRIVGGFTRPLSHALERLKEYIPEEIKRDIDRHVYNFRLFISDFVYKNANVKALRLSIMKTLNRMSRQNVNEFLSQVLHSIPAYHVRIYHYVKEAASRITWGPNVFVGQLRDFLDDLRYRLSYYFETTVWSAPYRFFRARWFYIESKIEEAREAWYDANSKLTDYLRNEEHLKDFMMNLRYLRAAVREKIHGVLQETRLHVLIDYVLHMIRHANAVHFSHSYARRDLKVEISSPVALYSFRSASSNASMPFSDMPWRLYNAVAFAKGILKNN